MSWRPLEIAWIQAYQTESLAAYIRWRRPCYFSLSVSRTRSFRAASTTDVSSYLGTTCSVNRLYLKSQSITRTCSDICVLSCANCWITLAETSWISVSYPPFLEKFSFVQLQTLWHGHCPLLLGKQRRRRRRWRGELSLLTFWLTSMMK